MDKSEKNEIILFEDGELTLEVNVAPQQETVWLTANQMSELYGRDEKTIRKHMNKIFNDGELDKENNTQKMRVVGVTGTSGKTVVASMVKSVMDHYCKAA